MTPPSVPEPMDPTMLVTPGPGAAGNAIAAFVGQALQSLREVDEDETTEPYDPEEAMADMEEQLED